MESPVHDTVPTIILCGGQGSRMRGLAQDVPKPMLPIGGRPILWHIMQIYAADGCTDFTLALGHLGHVIKEWVLHYETLSSDFRVELGSNRPPDILEAHREQGWRIACVDTGVDAGTGARVRRAGRHIDGDTLMVTYGDGLADIDVAALLDFHRSHGRLATVTAVRPPERFGELTLTRDGSVTSFDEKAARERGAVNGGFMVFERDVLDRYIGEDDVMLEREPMEKLVKDGELMAYVHAGFWHHMDTPNEHAVLDEMWSSGRAPWKRWS